MNGRFVAYYRVSTERQGRSGLGLEAQQSAVHAWLNGGAWELVAEFVEVESGKRNDRAELAKALEACRLHKSTLVIAKLDRLARDAAFLLSLRDAGVEFVAVDMPNANRLTVGIMALVAEDEAERCSTRTKAALAAAKARGQSLGGYRGGPAPSDEARNASLVARREKAKANAQPVLAEIGRIQAEGTTSANGIARVLNERGITTPRGGKWQAIQVQKLLIL